jgi:hypothetical protein
VNEEHTGNTLHIDDIYTKGWDISGPWNEVISRIRQDFEDTETMKAKMEALQEKVKEQTKTYLLIKREKDELNAVNQ